MKAMDGHLTHENGTLAKDRWRSVQFWHTDDVQAELYRCTPGARAVFPAHTHEEYQLYLNHDLPYRYTYRRATLLVPPGSVAFFQGGEAHGGEDLADRTIPSVFRLLYLPLPFLRTALFSDTEASTISPTVTRSLSTDPALRRHLLQFHRTLCRGEMPLERDAHLLLLVRHLFAHHITPSLRLPAVGREKSAVRQVREYLTEHFKEPITLNNIAEAANLNPFYLHRAFTSQVGVPPHKYLIHIRIGRAKRLLWQGVPLAVVAQEVGFADQSHFNRHFKQVVGVTPGKYRRSVLP